MSKLPQFTGLMAPTFTPFDDKNEIQLDSIGPYAEHLKSKGISAVLINGTTGEGMLLTFDERKRVTERWAEVCKKLDMLLMVQVGGCVKKDTIELAKHAASLKVDGILSLPELYFKPKTVEALVSYMKDIAVHCQGISLYFYHIPVYTQVDLPMPSFMELARREIPNFAGIKYSSGDLEKGLPCLQHGQVFIGSNTIWTAAVALGFTCAIMTPLNVKPEFSFNIVRLMEEGKVAEAREQQRSLNKFIRETLKKCESSIKHKSSQIIFYFHFQATVI